MDDLNFFLTKTFTIDENDLIKLEYNRQGKKKGQTDKRYSQKKIAEKKISYNKYILGGSIQ